jgi:hypothetical protein
VASAGISQDPKKAVERCEKVQEYTDLYVDYGYLADKAIQHSRGQAVAGVAIYTFVRERRSILLAYIRRQYILYVWDSLVPQVMVCT